METCALVYLGGWVITTIVTFVASQRFADGPTTTVNSLGFSLLAGLVWPLMIVGVVEFSSVVMYSSASSRRHNHGIPDSWFGADAIDGVVPLR